MTSTPETLEPIPADVRQLALRVVTEIAFDTDSTPEEIVARALLADRAAHAVQTEVEQLTARVATLETVIGKIAEVACSFGKPLPDLLFEIRNLAGANLPDEPDVCPICSVEFKVGDLCATDIEEGTCHAECLAGCPVVDLDSGEEIEGGKLHTFVYEAAAAPAGETQEGGL